MFEVTVISGELRPYKTKDGQDRELYEMWVLFPGCQFSFKMTFFRADQISKAKNYASTGKAKLRLTPDRNMQPSFELV